jgi:nucleoside-diphosphate-sugar epimerase
MRSDTGAVAAAATPEGIQRALQGTVTVVTGGSGFIGANLSARLRTLGAEVHTVGRSASRGAGEGRHWQTDLADPAAAASLVKALKPSYVFHLASHVMGAPDRHHVLPAFRSNLQTTVSLLCALADAGWTRMITAGSLVEPDENERSIPNSPYAAAKWASSDYARLFHALYDFPIAIARIFMVYGPRQNDMTKLVPYVIDSVLHGTAPKITSGSYAVDWIFVDDVVDGLIRLAVASGVDGKTVDLGSGSLITTKELVDLLCSLMEAPLSPVYGALPDRPLEPVRTADVAASARAIGWRPKTPLAEGLGRTIDWYRANLTSEREPQ